MIFSQSVFIKYCLTVHSLRPQIFTFCHQIDSNLVWKCKISLLSSDILWYTYTRISVFLSLATRLFLCTVECIALLPLQLHFPRNSISSTTPHYIQYIVIATSTLYSCFVFTQLDEHCYFISLLQAILFFLFLFWGVDLPVFLVCNDI